MKAVMDIFLRRFVACGELEVIYPDDSRKIYRGQSNGPIVAMAFKNNRALRQLLINPDLNFGEAYMDGTITVERGSLYDLVDLLVTSSMTSTLPAIRLFGYLRYLKRQWEQMNTAYISKRNISHHYDLNRSFYELFLDQDRQYSCAYFPKGNETLEEAQIAKKRHIASKLLLNHPDMEVLDIGSGWGGIALTLASEYNVRVTGITLSEEQLIVSRQRARDAGLDGRVTFEFRDYRSIDRQYDRIVSVGMFEHVGIGQYETFFATIKACLKNDGVMLLHSIGRSDGPGSTNPWINKYIFPGGYSPALSETLAAVERTGLWVTDCEIWRLHYARTLSLWRQRFEARRSDVVNMYDDRFYRMFELYLVGAELAFRREGHMNFQLQISPSLQAVPLSRDYMYEAERKREDIVVDREQQYDRQVPEHGNIHKNHAL